MSASLLVARVLAVLSVLLALIVGFFYWLGVAFCEDYSTHCDRAGYALLIGAVLLLVFPIALIVAAARKPNLSAVIFLVFVVVAAALAFGRPPLL